MTSSKAVFVACVLAGAAMSSLLAGCTEAEPSSDPSSVAQGCGDGGACVQTGVIAPVAGAAAALPDALPSRYPFWILQMNLCNSGFASCYDGGKSIPEAAAAIQNSAPDIVTLNEICQPDVVQLATTLSGVYSGSTVVWAFKAATDRRTNAAYKCKNGQDYGIGLVAHIPAPYNGYQTFSGIYASQDTSSAEERAWLCLYATGNFYACTTHLASTSGTVALAQCKNLMTTIIPSVRAPGGYEPTVLGGDLNLKYQGSPDAQSCVPAGYYRKGDGDVQHVMATTDLVFSSSHTIAMSHTDHPGWFVAVTAP